MTSDISDPHFDPYRELFELTRAFRLHLTWHEHYGRYGVVDAPTRTEDDVDLARLGPDRQPEPQAGRRSAGPEYRPERQRIEDPSPAPRAAAPSSGPRFGDASPRDALGFGTMSEALAHMLGEGQPAPARAPRQASGNDAIASPEPPVQAPAEPTAKPAAATPGVERPTLAQVRAELGDCTRCKLAPTRTRLVFGVGAEDAALMFIGEGPGEQEDLRGEPFVGRAGELLDKMIAAMGWSRDTVYIANVVKCRPPRNRDPEPDEIAACEPFLAKQIAAVRPRLIVTLGRPAAQLVLRSRQSIGRLRGSFHNHQGIPVMPTYHPAYLLRNPDAKRSTWNDLKRVIAELERMGVRSPHPPRA